MMDWKPIPGNRLPPCCSTTGVGIQRQSSASFGILLLVWGLCGFSAPAHTSGAEWEAHWSYQPIERPDVPTFSEADWGQNPIDAFILGELKRHDLQPSPEAGRRTLIRRLAFDLTGLPPHPALVTSFVEDQSRNAYEKVVDRLLSSPRFGERMAVHWLDLVRYADTVGYHGDQPVSVWPYRDYVIESYNANKPFDLFTIEQLAGDLLPGATRETRIASGYNRLNRMTSEGGSQPKEYLAKYAADRVRTTSTVWLGATLGCAECHDHKFDPYTAKDFYSFEAFFADLKEQGVYRTGNWGPTVKVPNEAQAKRLAELEKKMVSLEGKLKTPTKAVKEAQAAWEKELREKREAGRLGWEATRPRQVRSKGGATLEVLSDASVLSSGKNPESDTYEVELPTGHKRVTALRLEALPHPSLDKKSLSRGGGNFVLTDVAVEARHGEKGDFQAVRIEEAKADFSQDGFPIAHAIDSDAQSGWAVEGNKKSEPREALFRFAEPVVGDRMTLRVRLAHNSKHKHHNIGRFRFSTISIPRPTFDQYGVPKRVVEELSVPPGERGAEAETYLTDSYLAIAPELDSVRAALAKTRKEQRSLEKSVPTSLVSESVEPRVMRVLPRGNWMDDSGEIVTPAVPHFLPEIRHEGERATRFDLAEWLVSDRNPLTARVVMNRFWEMFFGEGLSKTLDDFGSQGERPTHPRLLDWLASEFRSSGWDMKAMIRLMVSSSTYRQQSVPTPRMRRLDPHNRLYARQSRFRLPAEMVRDNALAISGLLETKVGGPSIKPYQPDGYYAHLNFPKRTYQEDTGPAQYRRGVYIHWQRTFLHPSLKAFDAPSREECTADRMPSNTPLQALTLLNDPTYVEAARVLGAEIASESVSAFEGKLTILYRRALARPPRPEEKAELQQLFERQLKRYENAPGEAKALLEVGHASRPTEGDFPQMAAWTAVSRVVLNLHETIVRP